MALIRTGGVVGQISGGLGGDVFSRNRYGSYVRARTVPITSTTEAAMSAKARMTIATQAWQGLSAARKLSWKEWGLNNPTINRIGQQIHLTGHASYVGVKIRTLIAGTGAINDPPITPAPYGLESLSLAADIGPGNFAFTFGQTPLGATQYLWIEAAVADSPGINYIENIKRYVGISAAAQATGYDPQAQIEAVFGALVVDNVVHCLVSVFDSANGQLSAPLRCQATVVDTT